MLLIMSGNNKVKIDGLEGVIYANDLDYLSIARHAVQRTVSLGGNPLKAADILWYWIVWPRRSCLC